MNGRCPLYHDDPESVCLEYDEDPYGPGCRLCGHDEQCHTNAGGD